MPANEDFREVVVMLNSPFQKRKEPTVELNIINHIAKSMSSIFDYFIINRCNFY
jgi:hypothetical protein